MAGAIGSPFYLFDFDANTLDAVAGATALALIPEPATLALFAIGLAGRKRKAAL